MLRFEVLVGIILASASFVKAELDPRMVCAACVIVLGLTEQIDLQLELSSSLKSKCDGVKKCEEGIDDMILKLEAKAAPDDVCKSITLCEDKCENDNPNIPQLYVEWPVNPLPPQPYDWPTERRLGLKDDLKEAGQKLGHQLRDAASSVKEEVDDHIHAAGKALKELLNEMNLDVRTDGMVSKLGSVMLTVAKAMPYVLDRKNIKDENPDACGHNVTCHIYNFADTHLPMEDHDGDRYAAEKFGTMRGTHWRGYDCSDKESDIYPGRQLTSHESDVDHNCNGIYGANETGTFEDMFCAGTGQRGLIMLGDSATAHFHIPPQWMTAEGWNLDGLKEDTLDEFDAPQCSWGTGHVDPEDCPYQAPVPGDNPYPGIQSLYTMLRERNRCNHNDFQNIGVNGARMSSSMKLVNAMARSPTNDYPALVWLSLLGNDVCNGHPGYDHMSEPDDFYTNAMESLNAIDAIVPPGSHVVSPALFDGELLYDTMHALQHPLGTTYDGLYDFMNCLEINPCWGWLNSDAEVRANTTTRAQELSAVYQQIEDEQNFKNFKFVYYKPDWEQMFADYEAAGYPAGNLIEAVDGFHPSQAANNLFANYFFKFLEDNHPEAIGDVNPHNAEIDALFFGVDAQKTRTKA